MNNAMSCLIDATESARLDDLTAYNSTILNRVHSADLDTALAGEVKRHGKSDADLRTHALNSVHPDDLFAALAGRGLTLARFGITQISC